MNEHRAFSTAAQTPLPSPIPAATQPAPAAADGQERLPFDVRTTLVGIRRRIPLAVVIAVAASAAGALAGYLFGDRVFTATTVLLYRPPAGASADSEGNDAPSLRTQVDLVKIPSNLEEVRRRLRLAADISTLGSAFAVRVPENTSLLTIEATWDDAETTAMLANTLRDVFQEAQRNISRTEAQAKINDLDSRLSRVLDQQAKADTALKEYSTANNVVDLDKEAQWYLEQLINTELIYEQAVGEQQAVELQRSSLNSIVADLKSKVAIEERALESFGNSGAKSTDTDAEPLQGRMSIIELKQRELERAKRLRDQGILSQSQVDQMIAALEVERYSVFNHSPTAGVLKEMLVREMNIKLDAISAERKVSQLGEAVTRVKDKLKQLPAVQREYVMLRREVDARAAERQRIEQLVAGERRKVESEIFGFNLVSAAKPPVRPIRSNRRLLAMSIAGVGALAGLALIVLLELSDRRVKSVAEAELKLGVPVLAALPTYEMAGGPPVAERFIEAYQRIRRRWPDRGLTVMVAGAVAGGQSERVALELSRTMANHESPVLLIDAETRRVERALAGDAALPGQGRWLLRAAGRVMKIGRQAWAQWARPGTAEAAAAVRALGDDEGPGLREYLRGSVPDWRELVRVDAESGLATLPRGGKMATTGLASARMRDLVWEARRDYSCIVVHATAVIPLADAGFLAQYVDAVIVEVSSSQISVESGRTALQRLANGPAPVAGVILTGVDPVYLESHWA